MKKLTPSEFAVMAVDGPVSFVSSNGTRITYTPREYRAKDQGFGACRAEHWSVESLTA